MKQSRVGYYHGIGIVALGLSAMGGILAGCQKREAPALVPTEAQYKLLMPAKIDILPFTKPRSWDGDQTPDGIEVVLRPLDSFGDQTKAIGTFRFELYLFQKASAEIRGRRVGFWEETLTTREAQSLHWDKITRTYRFRLAWTGEPVRPGKYVLEVTYQTPLGERLADTYVFEARMPKEQYKEKIESQRQSPFKIF